MNRLIPLIIVLCTLPLSALRAQSTGPAAPSATLPANSCAASLPAPDEQTATTTATDSAAADPNAQPPIKISADEADIDLQGQSEVRGNVRVRQGDKQLRADKARYDAQSGTVAVDGHVEYDSDQLRLGSADGDFDMQTEKGRFEQTEFELKERGARGEAGTIVMAGRQRTDLEDVSYTTCQKGKEDWQLQASAISLRHDKGVGMAYNVNLRFFGIPLLYSPYLTFPINSQRKTGLLVPSIANSDNTGLDLRIPWYWNIAPDKDATFTARILSRRGLQLGGEFRYLTAQSHGQVVGELLPHDRAEDDLRALFSWQHQGALLDSPWQLRINYNQVTDDTYFQDLGDSLSAISVSHIPREAELSYRQPYWQIFGRLQSYQTVVQGLNSIEEPYQRLPQINMGGAWPVSRQLYLGVDSDLTNFVRDEGDEGLRVDLSPFARWHWRKPGYFLEPTLRLRYTRYQLRDLQSTGANTITRTIPTVSVDGGLIFDRRTDNGLVTLEPRAYYLYTPFRTQQEIGTVFDTGTPDFNLTQLFTPNRFTGIDRIGDANRFSAALTNRWLDSSGHEYLRFAAGSAIHFERRRIALPNETANSRKADNLLFEALWRPSQHWQFRTEQHWDPYDNHADKSTFALSYQPESNQIINVAYRRLRENNEPFEQTDVSFIWPVGERWRLVGRWNFSLDGDQTLESFGGLEYRTCCWAARFVSRRHLTDRNGDMNNSFYFQLEFTGFTSIGNGVDSLLERGILGYSRDDSD